MASDLRQQILNAQAAYEQRHGVAPSFLYLTVDQEAGVYGLLPAISPQLSERAFRDGVRAVLPQIFGMTVVYGSPKFCVTGESPVTDFILKSFKAKHGIDLTELPKSLKLIREEAQRAEEALRKGEAYSIEIEAVTANASGLINLVQKVRPSDVQLARI